MAAIARRFIPGRANATALFLGLLLSTSSRADDRQSELRKAISRVATALTGGNPSDALEPFSKSASGYEQLRGYFAALTDAFNVVNEAEVMSEEDTDVDSRLIVNWSITLNSKSDEPGRQRTAELHLRFARENGRWKITELTPLAFFDPTAAQ